MRKKQLKPINKKINDSLVATYWGEIYYKKFGCFKRYEKICFYTD
ncbi:MAG: hypothetical protein PHT02_01175 [Tissierellia bacterium]|nr:hypothetical protein [Tissierellia bacterium]